MRYYHRDPGDDIDAPPMTPQERAAREKMLKEIDDKAKANRKDEPYDPKFWHGEGVQGPQ